MCKWEYSIFLYTQRKLVSLMSALVSVLVTVNPQSHVSQPLGQFFCTFVVLLSSLVTLKFNCGVWGQVCGFPQGSQS